MLQSNQKNQIKLKFKNFSKEFSKIKVFRLIKLDFSGNSILNQKLNESQLLKLICQIRLFHC